ncbi:MAG: hypothetical protein WCT18_03830 [Patescibacteria group bacterium]
MGEKTWTDCVRDYNKAKEEMEIFERQMATFKAMIIKRLFASNNSEKLKELKQENFVYYSYMRDLLLKIFETGNKIVFGARSGEFWQFRTTFFPNTLIFPSYEENVFLKGNQPTEKLIGAIYGKFYFGDETPFVVKIRDRIFFCQHLCYPVVNRFVEIP